MTQVKESSLLDGLNERQVEAVRDTIDRSSLILASAGSGKTAVLIRRIAYLIELGVNPAEIMAVTFTNKASLEMQNRLSDMIGQPVTKQVSMGTFHKICIIMLKKYGDRIALDRLFAIAGPSDQKSVMKAALLENNTTPDSNNIKLMLTKVSNIKGELMSPYEFAAQLGNGLDAAGDAEMFRVYESYQNGLNRLNMLDFDDLIYFAIKLLVDSEEIRTYYQARYQHILLDEYQDTNPSQYKLMALIAGKELPTKPVSSNVFAVGDDFQSVYSFRGSDIGIILGFQQDFPEAKIIKLEQNYRSTKAIVHSGNKVIENNVKQTKKVAYTANANGEKVKVFRAYKSDEEAEFVAQEIQNLISYGGYQPKDFAILYRMNALSREVEKKLIDQRIPYKILKGTSFFERMEIKDTLAYLKAIANPKDDIAMERILNLTPGIGKASIELIKEEAKGMGVGISEALKYFKPSRKALATALEDMRQLLTDLYLIYQFSKNDGGQKPITQMLDIAWQRTGYTAELQLNPSDDNNARLENLNELRRIGSLYETTEENPTLADFLDGITLNTSDDKDVPSNTVNLMTVHASKGLEFPVVFVIGMNEEVFPSKMSAEEEDGIEEERRIFYVAVTRAEKLLYVSYAKVRNMYGSQQWLAPSRFLEELPKDAVENVF